MKKHTTNYFDTFIEAAADTKAQKGLIPPIKATRTVAERQYELILKNPYTYTSDDILFQIFADRNDLPETAYPEASEQFFSKGQPCLRTSPLTKTYGFGIHCNNEGKIALYGIETAIYQKFLNDPLIKKVKAMKSGR